ncbi:MAG: DUF177 domain-containing protein [Myxococcales bacterium]|nr:DUF177 domain-containing protein [Myxococcales bacterium]
MVVNIEEILEGGLELDKEIPSELLDQALLADGKGTGFRARGAPRLAARLTKVSGGVLLEGRLSARLVAPCKRCVTEVDLDVPVDFTLNLVAHPAPGSGEAAEDKPGVRAGSFSLEEADEERFDGRTIDLDPILREQVLLALPVTVVCEEGCLGLCTLCGQNLNERQCGCERKPPDPRLAKLGEIKLN